MPFNIVLLDKLERLLTRVDIPVQKKSGLVRNVNKITWLKENFDVRNAQHPKRDDIMKLIDEILQP